MNFKHINFSLDGPVAVVRISTPGDNGHTLSTPLLRELQEAVTFVRDDQTVRLLMLIGKGRSFSVGADIGEITGSEERSIPEILRAGQSVLRQILDLDIMTIAAVNGPALGGGLELALACDIRWAHVSAVFGFPEAKIGLLPGWGGMPLLSRAVPASLCADLLASGAFIGAARASETGLVSRVFETAVLAAAKTLAGRPPAALIEIKGLLRRLRGDVDLTAGDRPFLRLWSGQAAAREAFMTMRGGQ